jgi:hypothetical protein
LKFNLKRKEVPWWDVSNFAALFSKELADMIYIAHADFTDEEQSRPLQSFLENMYLYR